MPECRGIMCIDKSAGMTSHDVVDSVRRRLGMRRVGHAGTLDPDATGLLIVLIGPATRLFAQFSQFDKTYDVTLTLGIVTSTADAGGDILARHPVPRLSEAEIERIAVTFRGEITQVPPMFSAKKMRGKKLYELARRGIVVERPPQRIMIHELRVGQVSLPQISFFVRCSKGTYVRTLCEDMGTKLGCGGHMSRLRRLAVGPYHIDDAVTMDELRLLPCESLRERIRGME